MYANRTANSGFTLVEVSIVLVVIGLLIGSILVAINILQSARITSTISALQSIQSAISTYNQNYGALPGDDTQAVSRFTGVATNNGGGDGYIGTTTSFNTTAVPANGNGAPESRMAWANLRAAGLIKGQGTDSAQPGNSFGGIFGLQRGAFTGTGAITDINVVCIDKIPAAAAAIIDQRQDDGNPSTGSIRGATDISAAATATSYVEPNVYILCTRAL